MIDWTKPLRTSNGRTAHLVDPQYKQEGKPIRKLVAVDYSGHKTHYTYEEDGTHVGGAKYLNLENPA